MVHPLGLDLGRRGSLPRYSTTLIFSSGPTGKGAGLLIPLFRVRVPGREPIPWPRRLLARISAFHAEEDGSKPFGATTLWRSDMIGRSRFNGLIAAAALGLAARPISEEYEYDDDHLSPEDPGYFGALSHSIRRHPSDKQIMPYRKRDDLEYFDSGKPLTRRQRRKLKR